MIAERVAVLDAQIAALRQSLRSASPCQHAAARRGEKQWQPLRADLDRLARLERRRAMLLEAYREPAR